MKEYLDKNINYMESLDKANNLSINGKIELNLLKEVKKQLIITDVGQQRELLNALADDFNDSTDTYVGQPMIEETLKAFNCG